jgi:hypothetical protein
MPALQPGQELCCLTWLDGSQDLKGLCIGSIRFPPIFLYVGHGSPACPGDSRATRTAVRPSPGAG